MDERSQTVRRVKRNDVASPYAPGMVERCNSVHDRSELAHAQATRGSRVDLRVLRPDQWLVCHHCKRAKPVKEIARAELGIGAEAGSDRGWPRRPRARRAHRATSNSLSKPGTPTSGRGFGPGAARMMSLISRSSKSGASF